MAALTDKQEAFCQQYLLDLNATQAAIRAGYSEKTAQEQGSRLLSNVIVASRVRELMAGRAQRVQVDGDWVLGRLIEISDKCMEAKAVMVFDPVDKCLVQKATPDGELLYEFDSSGANKATELIGKHLGFFEQHQKQKGKVTLKIGGRTISPPNGNGD
jgi:phage terminase small subunit